MTSPGLAEAAPGITMTVTAQIKHCCPFVDEIDEGTIAIVWVTDDGTIELHSLAAFLDCYADRKISHEDLVNEIFGCLEELTPHIIVRSVSARFTTAGIDVEVSRAVPVDAVNG